MKNITKQLKKGDQIAYIPDHVSADDLEHRDIEFGFIMEIHSKGGVALCRYWRREEPRNYLRTVANGEITPISNLKLYDSVDQSIVNRLIGLIDRDELTMGNCFYEI